LETIALLEEELIANAEKIGRHILSRIENWPERFKPVGQVRGLGLMIGIELVADKTTKDPAPELRDRVVQQAFHRGLLVFDEVQSGMGRTGRMWASEHSGVEPDIIASAKGIASGMPLGATIAADHIMDWPPGAHGSTFGGNPVAIAAALETIALLEEELIANAERIGRHILSRIENWRERFKPVGQVRGLGLMIGIELVADKTSKDPAPELRDRLVQQAFHRGLLVLGCGKSTIRISPPLMISQEQADFAMDVLEQILREEAG
jgi:4-aminobutyrate aminotransferase